MARNKIIGAFSKNSLLLSGLIGIVITMIASSIIFCTTMERHQSFARCSNGYHISPSGVCEQVIQPSTELPRCPNGYHRSPSLDCEQVTPSSNNSPYQNPSSPYQQQQPRYPPQAQFSQPQQQQGMGRLMNESAVIGCLNHVLNNALVKANVSKFVSQTNLTNSVNELDACILPRR